MNQKGFIYPLTIMVCFIFLFLMVSLLNAYFVELRFSKEQEELFVLESLKQSSAVDIVSEIERNELQKTLIYPHGKAIYNAVMISEGTFKVTVEYITNDNRRSKIIFFYNQIVKGIEKWVEG